MVDVDLDTNQIEVVKMEYIFNEDNFETEVLNSNLPVLVDFYADWCGPCKMMASVVENAAEEFEGKLKVGKCNVDDNMLIAAKYGIASIPAFMIFKAGKVTATFVGAMPGDEFVDRIEKEL